MPSSLRIKEDFKFALGTFFIARRYDDTSCTYKHCIARLGIDLCPHRHITPYCKCETLIGIGIQIQGRRNKSRMDINC